MQQQATSSNTDSLQIAYLIFLGQRSRTRRSGSGGAAASGRRRCRHPCTTLQSSWYLDGPPQARFACCLRYAAVWKSRGFIKKISCRVFFFSKTRGFLKNGEALRVVEDRGPVTAPREHLHRLTWLLLACLRVCVDCWGI